VQDIGANTQFGKLLDHDLMTVAEAPPNASEGLVAPAASISPRGWLKHFQAKRMPVRVKKMRQSEDRTLLTKSTESESALGAKPTSARADLS